jgi:hypothetical protein
MAERLKFLCLEGSRRLDKRREARQVDGMDRNNLPGLSPLWLISLALVLGIFVSVMIPLVVSVDAINSTAWIGFCGSFIGAAIAVAALLVATRNVRHQMRINVFSREEQRIEDEMPGLSEASDFLMLISVQFSGDVSASGALFTLSANGFNQSTTSFLADVEQRLPLATDALRRHLAGILSAIWASSATVRATEQRIEAASKRMESTTAPQAYRDDAARAWGAGNERVIGQRTMLATYIRYLQSLNETTAKRIKRLESRRAVCRSEIDWFFEDR